jgi:hypothetical protein
MKVFMVKPERKRPFENLGVDGRIILKRNFKESLGLIQLAQDRALVTTVTNLRFH